jgi:DNA segregation ATPase FtsK/SpoIIIE, S-DNA-T family
MSSLTLDLWNLFETRMRAVWQSPLMARMRGAFVVLGGLATLLALATYHPDDSSLNAISHSPVRNVLGRFGAIVSDLSWQSIGLAAWPGAVLMVYFGALRTFHHDPDQTRGAIRRHALFGILFLLALSAAFGPVPTAKDPIIAQSLGGFWGSGLNHMLASVFAFMRLPAGPIIASVLFAGLAFYGFNQTLNLKLQSYLRLAHFLGGGLKATGLGGVASGLASGLRANVAAKAKVVQAPKGKKAKAQPVIADEDEDGFETVAELPAAPRDVKVAPRIQPTVAPTRPVPQPETMFEDDDMDGEDMVPIMPPVTQTKVPAAAAAKQPEFDFLRPSNFKLPGLSILAKPKVRSQAFDEESLRQNARMLESVLAEFGVRGVIDQIRPGPVVTLYELAPAAGVKGARVVALADDIARNMSARSCRVSVVQGRNAIGIELPNQTRETVYFRDLLASSEYERSTHILPMALGETIGGEPYITDLAKMPHLLIAGTTGSGKSVGVNAMILSILYRLDPEQCKFIMIDPKMLELSVYDGIPHLLTPVVTDPKKAVVALKWTVKEMEDRYRRMSKIGVRNIASFNERARATAAEGKNFIRKVQTGFDETGQPIYEYDEMVPEPMPYLVVVVDEVADLMMVAGKDIEGAVQRLAQMARAAGIHLIMATQRPSVDVITGTIKANFPTRISFQVTSKIDSRTILGEQGAEQLLGQGDMLYMAGGGRITRLHGPFVSDGEVEAVAQFLRDQGQPNYLDDVTYGGEDEAGSGEGGTGEGGGSGDDLYDKAVYFVTFDRKASTSYIQRKLQIGYNRAASLMEKMEQEGVVGPANHVGKRDILVGPPPGH